MVRGKRLPGPAFTAVDDAGVVERVERREVVRPCAADLVADEPVTALPGEVERRRGREAAGPFVGVPLVLVEVVVDEAGVVPLTPSAAPFAAAVVASSCDLVAASCDLFGELRRAL